MNFPLKIAINIANSVIAIAVVVVVLIHCRQGFDITDEGFYLNWTNDPWLYPYSLSQFGFVYHPIYALLDGNIVTFRQCNVLFTIGLALYLVFSLEPDSLRQSPLRSDIIFTPPIAITAMTLFLWGVFTPSYNSLVIHGVMIAAIGVILSNSGTWIAGIYIGLGGALVFLGKPSSAVLLGVIVPAVVWFVSKRPVHTLFLAVAACVLCMTIATLYISGSVTELLARMKGGHEGVLTLLPRYGIWEIIRIDSPRFKMGETVAFVLLLALAAGSGISPQYASKFESTILLIIAGTAMIAILIFCAFPFLLGDISERPHRTAVLLAAVPLGIVFATLIKSRSNLPRVHSNTLALAVFFAVLPYIVAFGTANNTTHQSSYAALFWIIAGLLLAKNVLEGASSRVATVALVCSAVAISAILMLAGMEKPYRQETALRQQHTPAYIGPQRRQELLVDTETARYLTNLTTELTRMGFHRGDGIIDMTGESPGIEFAVGGIALGEPWLPGRYSGSAAYAIRALSRIPCDTLARAWILLAPGGRRALPVEVLTSQGIDPTAAEKGQKIRRRHREDYHQIVMFRDSETESARCQLTRRTGR